MSTGIKLHIDTISQYMSRYIIDIRAPADTRDITVRLTTENEQLVMTQHWRMTPVPMRNILDRGIFAQPV